MEERRDSGPFDRAAAAVAGQVAKAWFFSACALMVLIWAPSYFLLGDLDLWQLIINTATTIVTFLLVALLQNTQERSTAAMQHKLDALAEGLAQVLDQTDGADESGDQARRLREMAGISMEGSGE